MNVLKDFGKVSAKRRYFSIQMEENNGKDTVIPNKGVNLAFMVENSIAPPEATDLDFQASGDESLSPDDAGVYVEDKIDALNALVAYDKAYKEAQSKAEADRIAAQAAGLQKSVDNVTNVNVDPNVSAGNN